ncbi:MAG: hypothetical protein ACFCVC_13700 [Acidimicrobiia bacterium]
MGAYKAKLTVPGVLDWPLAVEIDLNEGRLAISTGTGEIGAWDIDDIEVLGRDNGFELRAEGDVILFSTIDDGRFAREVGLQWAPPRLRRLMAVDLSRSTVALEGPPVRVFPPTPGLREHFSASIDGAVDATAEPADDELDGGGNVDDADAAPRKRKGRHQRRGKGRHLRPVAG